MNILNLALSAKMRRTMVEKGNMNLRLSTGPLAFVPPYWEAIKRDKALLFVWIGETELANVIYWRSITLRVGWPPIKFVSCFTFTDDEERISV